MEKLRPTLVSTVKVPSVTEVLGRNLPEKKFRSGAIAATIWANSTVRDGKPATYRTISLQRSYKDKNDEWKSTDSMRVNDLPKAVLVLSKAYEYLALNSEEIDEESIY